jgi:hypothetical protein
MQFQKILFVLVGGVRGYPSSWFVVTRSWFILTTNHKPARTDRGALIIFVI